MAKDGIGGALTGTLETLRGGVVRLGLEAALPEISAWEERLTASGDPGLEVIAKTLSELRVQLDPDGFDPVTIGALLMSLGDQVEQFAGTEGGEQVRDRLSQLGKLLGDEGDALTDGLTKV